MTETQHTPALDADAQIALALIDGFRSSKAAFTAISLGIFDLLHEQPASLDELALKLNCPAAALDRLLGACCGLGLLDVTGGLYRNRTAAARFLRTTSPETLSGYMLYSDRVGYRLWAHLEDAIREGSNRWSQEFGEGQEGIFGHFFRDDAAKRTFLAAMHGMGMLSSPAIAQGLELGRFERLVDVGGGTGHLAIAICRRYPRVSATVFDLPAVTDVTRQYINEAGLSDRIAALEGDFFSDPLPAADLYGLGRILHDWPDEKVRSLLSKVCESLPPAGGLLICEKLLNEERDGPATAYLQSLNMLVCTEGRERSASEYEALVRAAGFSEFAVCCTDGPLDGMLAVK